MTRNVRSNRGSRGRALVRAALSALVASALSACVGILDIQDAKLEPQGAGGGGGGGAGGGDAGSQASQICVRYCDSVMANCTGAMKQWPSKAVCLLACVRLPEGTENDTANDTVGCRLHYADLAQQAEPAFNCPAAGPGGNGVCGSDCEGLCTLALSTCERQKIFSTVAECEQVCSSIPDLGTYDQSIQTGKTVQCRLYHVSAAQLDPVFHCPHVAGAGPCSGP
jgi:hypothetical protein